MRKLWHRRIYMVPFYKRKMHSELMKFLDMIGLGVSELSESQDQNWRNFCNSHGSTRGGRGSFHPPMRTTPHCQHPSFILRHTCTASRCPQGCPTMLAEKRRSFHQHGEASPGSGAGRGGRALGCSGSPRAEPSPTCRQQYASISLLSGVCRFILNCTTEPSCPATFTSMGSFSVFTPSWMENCRVWGAQSPGRVNPGAPLEPGIPRPAPLPPTPAGTPRQPRREAAPRPPSSPSLRRLLPLLSPPHPGLLLRHGGGAPGSGRGGVANGQGAGRGRVQAPPR